MSFMAYNTAPNIRDTALHFLRPVATNGVSFGPHSFSDLGFADNVAFLAELLGTLYLY